MLSRAVVARLRSRVRRRHEPAGRINKRTSSIIDAALVVLADGRPRTYIEIYTEARKRKLVANVNEKTWYNSIQEYVQRRIAGGRDSLIVQDVDRRSRLNHPADDWPDPRGPLPAGRSIPNTAELIALLQKTARGFDPDAFEIAVCRAFEALGYAARHIGGHAAPEDAPLLNEDAAMMTVDAALVAHGAHLPCTRDDVRAAFSHLCDPLVGLAVYAGDGKGIVVCAAGSA